MANKDRNIVYVGKDFNSIKSNLEQYAKTYFSKTYNDFSESSPGTMFMEMASYVGDIMSFYTDSQIQENFIQHATQTSNVYDLAYLLGYKPKLTSLSSTMVDFFQLVPSRIVNGEQKPDMRYTLSVKPYTQLSNDSGVNFFIEEGINFNISTVSDPTEISIAQIDNNGPTYFLLKKSRKASSGTINTKVYTFNDYEEFPTIDINDSNLSYIIEVKDSDNNTWYEVDSLGQDLVYRPSFNVNYVDSEDQDAPYILETFNTQRRFVSRATTPTTFQVQFGSGKPSDDDVELLPTFENVGIGLENGSQTRMTTAYSPTNFIFTDSYGIAPSNISLTFTYVTGGGLNSNVDSNTIRKLKNKQDIYFNDLSIQGNTSILNYIKDNFYVNNPFPSTGGGDGDTIDDIKLNSSANFSSQMRNVTKGDYLIRTLSLHPKYGAISKAFSRKPLQSQDKTTLDVYILSQNSNGNLKQTSSILKNNLKTYLDQYRILGDIINIKDAFVINIELNFEIITLPNFNNHKVISDCILALKEHFNISKWKINEPIIIKDIEVLLDRIEGVQTVKNIEIKNISGEENGYSKYSYDILGATKNKIIYPSLDPSIFEIKNPDINIKGRVLSI